MLTITPHAIRLTLRVQPRAAHNRVVGVHGAALKVQVTAPPVDGAANAAVVELVADWLAVPRRAVRLVVGESGRDKVVEVASDDPPGLAARVAARVGVR